jgi:hypothetical protein
MQGLIASTTIPSKRVDVRLSEAGRFASKSTVNAILNLRHIVCSSLDRRIVEYIANRQDDDGGYVFAQGPDSNAQAHPPEKNQVILDVFLDRNTHEKLVEYCRKNSFDLSTGFVKATMRGMRFFRAVYYKEMKQDYVLLKKLAEIYENDNRALGQLEEENQTLRQMLNAHECKSKGIRIET